MSDETSEAVEDLYRGGCSWRIARFQMELEHEGFRRRLKQTDAAPTSASLKKSLTILLDIMLPDRRAGSLPECPYRRMCPSSLTAKDDEDKAEGLDIGANDYLTKLRH